MEGKTDAALGSPAPATVEGEFKSLARGARLSDRVAEVMRGAITARNLAPGTQLPTERELGEQFGVSRTVVREAVRILAAQGLVDVRSGSGLRVAAVDPSTVRQSLSWFIRGGRFEYAQVHEIRDVIEVQMAGIAAERRTTDHLDELRVLHRRFADLVSQDVESAAIADVAFHTEIARATGNPLFAVILDSIAHALIDVRKALLGAGVGKDIVDQHAKILERIVAADMAGARGAMREHLQTVKTLQTSQGT